MGLGNPGSKYESTRHNMGWLALDSLMEKEKFALNKLRFKAWTGMLDYKGHKILVMKPQTYMNLSGESVGEAARFYKVPADHVLVISDDVSLPVGKLRIRKPQGEEAKALRAALDRAADAALSVIDEGPDRAMNRFN